MGCRQSETDGRTATTKVDIVKSVPHRLGADVDVQGRPQLLSDTACSGFITVLYKRNNRAFS